VTCHLKAASLTWSLHYTVDCEDGGKPSLSEAAVIQWTGQEAGKLYQTLWCQEVCGSYHGLKTGYLNCGFS
jgi:hypothetical protein